MAPERWQGSPEVTGPLGYIGARFALLHTMPETHAYHMWLWHTPVRPDGAGAHNTQRGLPQEMLVLSARQADSHCAKDPVFFWKLSSFGPCSYGHACTCASMHAHLPGRSDELETVPVAGERAERELREQVLWLTKKHARVPLRSSPTLARVC
jgi:hypothetical protein